MARIRVVIWHLKNLHVVSLCAENPLKVVIIHIRRDVHARANAIMDSLVLCPGHVPMTTTSHVKSISDFILRSDLFTSWEYPMQFSTKDVSYISRTVARLWENIQQVFASLWKTSNSLAIIKILAIMSNKKKFLSFRT